MDCTAETCPTANGFLWSQPSLEGSAFMLAAFGGLAVINFFICYRYRTPLYSAVMVTGFLFEVLGYAGRILLRTDLASRAYFLLFLLGTIVGPTFISAAIYIVLPHILVMYGRDVSLVSRPLYLGFVFVAFDVFTLVFQAVGCAFAAHGTSKAEMSQGLSVLVGGLGIQLGSLTVFFVILYWFLVALTRNRETLDTRHADIYLSSRFKIFLLCLQIAAGFILVRTVIRIVQLAHGLDSVLAQSQVLTLVLDGAEVLFAGIILTMAPPGAAFGSAWARTSPARSKSKSPPSPPSLALDEQDRQRYRHHGRHGRHPAAYQATNFTHTKTSRAEPTTVTHWQEQMKQQQQQQADNTTAQQQQQQRPSFAQFAPPSTYYRPPPPVPSSGGSSGGAAPSGPLPSPPRRPPYEIPPQRVPYMPPRPRRSQSPGTVMSSPVARNGVVDPDALWD